MSAATRARIRYGKYYASLHWIQLTNPGPAGEPDPCGPSIEALTDQARRDYHRYADDFNPRWSPDRRELRSRWIPLDFN